MKLKRLRRARRLRPRPAHAVAGQDRPERHCGPGRELASRSTDGLNIVLLWDPRDGGVAVVVCDSRNGREIRFPVDRARALDAFHHPFAYAP